jgi:hypothetical protein
MKVDYNYEEQIRTCICSVCGYKYTEEMEVYGGTLEGDEPFIEMEEIFHDTDDCKHSIYACPKCGVIQLDV